MSESERKMGRYTISKISELELANFTPKRLFPDLAGQADDAALFPSRLLSPAGNIVLSVHSWLLRDANRTILIDTGAGAKKARPFSTYFDNLNTSFLEQLKLAGVEPEDVDFILLTHLHVDHVGWNTIWDGEVWQPTFPKAKYVFSADEYGFFSMPENHSERHRTSFMARADSIDPVVKAGQAMMIAVDGNEVLPGIRYLPTPGHSPFHASISVDTGDGIALFAGDTLHHHAQVLRPDINSTFDADADLARQSRRHLLEWASASDTVVFGAHLAGTSAIRVDKMAGKYRWAEA